MKEVDPRELSAVRAEYERRLARLGDILIERYGVEIMAEMGHPELDLFDYAINRALELEWFVDQVVQRSKMMRDLNPEAAYPQSQRQSTMLTDIDMAGIRTRSLAFKLIEMRRLAQRVHGPNLGGTEHGGLSRD